MLKSKCLHIEISEKQLKRKLFFVALLTLLLPQLLSYSYTRSYDDCCVNQVQLTGYQQASNGYVNVNISEAKQMIESNPDLVILDVRTQGEYDEGHIENAVLIPVSELEERLDELDKEKDTLVYCRSGGRSVTASQILVDNGFVSVYNMLGGITAWRNSGYWIEIIHRGDLIIDGTQTYVIENCTYIQTGNIFVSDHAKLIIRNSVLSMNQTYLFQFVLAVKNWATLEMVNSVVSAFGTFGLYGTDDSKISIVNSYSDVLSVGGDGKSSVAINGSTLGDVSLWGDSKTVISNSHVRWHVTLDFQWTAYSNQIIRVYGLKSGYFNYWDLRQNQTDAYVGFDCTLVNTFVDGWALNFNHDTKAIISDSGISEMGIWYSETIASIQGLRSGFHYDWTLNNIALQNTSIGHWFLLISDSSVEIRDIQDPQAIFWANGKSNISISNSSNLRLHEASYFLGIMNINQSIFTIEGFMNSDFNIRGNIGKINGPEYWVSSNVSRNYNAIAKDISGNLVENVELSLFDQNDTVVWNGVTDSLGQASFNLTFTDNNYTDTLKLEAVKGNYSATMNVGFLSGTPVVLTMRYFADLNGDGTINIQDLFIVAKTYGSHGPDIPNPGDPASEKWNAIADVNKDGWVNIQDLFEVAKDYGKTV